MEKNAPWPLFVLASSDTAVGRRIRRAVKAGELKQVAPRLYTSNVLATPQELVRANWFMVLPLLYPESVISFRSAIEAKPTVDGNIYLSYKYSKKIRIPGLTIHLIEGPGPLNGDQSFGQSPLYFASEVRAILENLLPGKTRAGTSRALPQASIEERLEQILRVRSEDALNQMRDRAKIIAAEQGWSVAYERLNQLISALLSTAPVRILKSPIAIARANGKPFDQFRVNLFGKLFEHLKQLTWPQHVVKHESQAGFADLAFFEAYFSNFIEGTVFEVDEAHEMIKGLRPVMGRHADSHDVISTYQMVSNLTEMQTVPDSPESLIDLLISRHERLMRERPDKRPGQFKIARNQAGNTLFVDPELVIGTLEQGYNFYKASETPEARAAMIMFVISEVHPFDDGNGRLARIMMNAELVKGQRSKIIITTDRRQDYLRALRRLSRQEDPSLFCRMLSTAQRFTAALNPDGGYAVLDAQLRAAKAYEEANENDLF